ncbi:MAG: flippase-like domain-containing protein, partial [Muribaculaceae bacterium]|nr:flippase-like domain-containing protein [Muribaculaceae bacterium]
MCYLLFSQVNAGELVDAMRACRWPWMVASLLLGVAAQIWRAYRWRLQLTPLGVTPPMHAMINSIFGTYAVNLVFPRLGEVWRTGYIANREQAPFATVFGSMIADRLADTLSVLIITVLTFAAASQAMAEFMQVTDAGRRMLDVMRNPWLWTLLVVIITASIWVIIRNPHNRVVSKLRELLTGMWHGFASIMGMPHKGRWLLLTVAIWGSYFVEMYISMLA